MHITSTPVVPFTHATSSSHVAPTQLSDETHKLPSRRKPTARSRPETMTFREVVAALSHLFSWVLVATLVLSQFTCIISDSQTSNQNPSYGRDPSKGPYSIDGYNDEPYSDRSLACIQQGRLFRPMQLSSVLASSTFKARVVDTTGTSVSGYRIVPRHEIDLLETTAQRYSLACDVIATLLEPIARACQAAGYNVVDTSADLHILDGISTQETTAIVKSLPVIIMPYWDNAIYARYAMPAVDGSACMFHLSGRFDSEAASGAWFYLTNRREREEKTMEWLGISPKGGATWRNGWLEDPATGMKWYSDMSSSVNVKKRLFEPARYFDLLTGQEVDCVLSSSLCHPNAVTEWWGNKFSNTDQQLWVNSVAISNGTRYGLFLYEASQDSTAQSLYDLATLISNSTVITLLFRWLAANVALFNTYRHGYSRNRGGFTTDIGCLSCSRGFECLPLVLLPRLSVALAGFFTAGCQFEGEQRAFSEAWFAIYPALAEVMLFFYSLMNLVAKGLGRRMSDALFSPSLLTFCLLHRFRRSLSNAGWYEFDGRIATVMTAPEYEKLRLVEFFTTDAAFRLNGNVRSIFIFKLIVLAANLLPLIFSKKITKQPWVSTPSRNNGYKNDKSTVTTIERALGVKASESSGLGLSSIYIHEMQDPHRYLSAYELVRLGYVTFGDSFVISLSDWLLFVPLALFQLRQQPFGFRVMAFRLVVTHESPSSTRVRCDVEHDKLKLYQLHDEQLLQTSVWDISARPLP